MSTRLDLDDEDIIKRYLAGESMNSIGASYGVSYRPIATRLKAAGIEIRSRGNSSTTAATYTPNPIAVELRRLRLKFDLTHAQVARRAGVDETTLRRIELGRSNGNLRQIVAIANALGQELKLVPSLEPPQWLRSHFDRIRTLPTATATWSTARRGGS